MRLFVFDITNSLSGDQQFLCEADDLISAHMLAIEFAHDLEAKIKERFDIDEATKVALVAAPSLLRADANGVSEYLDSIKMYCGEEED